MNLLYKNRANKDKQFIFTVCDDICRTPYLDKHFSHDFAAIFVDGRHRECCLEDIAAISSFNIYSEYNYPIFCFLSNPDFFAKCNQKGIQSSRIQIIKIPEITSSVEYTKFCIEKLYFMLPSHIEKVLTLQPDAMLLKSGWEEFANKSGVDWLGPHWMHRAAIEVFDEISWNRNPNFFPTPIGNGGLSFRRASKMREISKNFAAFKQREYGRIDDRIPMEDLFFCYWGFNSGIMISPNLEMCNKFAKDPLTPEIYFGNNKPFGFHFFKDLSE